MAAAINKLKSDSRFVSVFADNTPDVDITFMIPFLQRPTDHYMVGVDNLTISLSALGLLEDTLTEPDPKDIIMQVIAKRKSIVGGPALGPSLDRAKGDFLVTENDNMKFRTSGVHDSKSERIHDPAGRVWIRCQCEDRERTDCWSLGYHVHIWLRNRYEHGGWGCTILPCACLGVSSRASLRARNL